MKKFFLTIIALVGSVACYAQLSDGVSATLQAGKTTTVFYGYDAFKDAVAAAPADAVSTIILSPGAFNNPGVISKSLKIYGAGFLPDVVNNISETRVVGDFYISSTEDFTPVVRMEGVYIVAQLILNGKQTISNTEIVKCSFANYYNRTETHNTIIRQSYIRDRLKGEGYKATDFFISNCYFVMIDEGFAAGSNLVADHCVITDGYYRMGVCLYSNNIINPSHGYRIQAGSTCYNNVCGNEKLDVGGSNVCEGNYDKSQWTDFKTLFADGQDNLDFFVTETTTPRTWVLADPTTYVGTDGSPCGVTGGDFPWNPIPATPRILSTSVDAKTTPGTLKVSVKAEARPLE